MPVYEYECDVCEMRFDFRRHFGDPHATTCPAGHTGVHRVFAAPTIIFKGSGFYVTDHARNGRVSSASSRDKDSAKPDKGETKAEAKTGAKEGAKS